MTLPTATMVAVTGQGGQAALQELLTPEGRELVDALTPYDASTALGRLEAVRRDPRWSQRPELVAAAATQARLRTRARARFPGAPRWWTPDGLEQATRPDVADRHAARYVAAGITRVADLGCGAGSDALAMAAAGLAVECVDLDPDALWAASATAADRGLSITIRHGDIMTVPARWNLPSPDGPDDPFGCFVDPARRRGGARALAAESWSPPWSWVRALAARVPATGAKLAPGIDHALLPDGPQVEWVSVSGDLVEAAAWWGPLRQGPARRVATTLRDGVAVGLDDSDGVPQAAIGPVTGWLLEPDPAVIRAGLVSVLAERIDGHLLDPRIAYIAARGAPPESPLAARFEVLDEVPFARKAMRSWLRQRGFGDVVVKKRGVNVVPEELRGALRLEGAGPTATLVLTRTDAGPLALLVERS
jgi:SAM-dependent methyltransferase